MSARIILTVLAAAIAVAPAIRSDAGPLDDARAAIERGELERARGLLEPYLASSPPREAAGEALYLLGSATTDAARCNEYDRRLLDDYKNHARAPYAALRAGQYLYAMGEYERAADLFQGLARSKSGVLGADGSLWLGMTLLATGQLGPAREAFRAAEGSGRLAGAARVGEGDTFLAESKFEDALDRYRDASDLTDSPLRAVALYKAGLVAREVGRPEEARGYFETLAREFPASAETGLALALMPPPEAPSSAPAPAAVPAPGDTAAIAASFSVQVGAFSERGNAARLHEQISELGFPDPRIEPEPGADRVLFTVRFGRYPSAEAAEEAGRQFAEPAGMAFSTVSEGAGADSSVAADSASAPEPE